jgi:aryl-alcohol dehydrogenase-like predicted oxidoreductase
MIRRRLAHTDLDLPIISFGASSLGHAFGYVNKEAAFETIHTALQVGINHFDTSPFYGRGISEVLLGAALRDVPREQFTLSTKLGRYDEDKFDFRKQRVVESIDTSLFRLGVDYLDIVFLHDVEFTDFRRSIDEAMPALLKEKEQGKVRYVGIAGYPFKPVLYAIENYDIDVTLNYNHYTLQNRRLTTELLPLLQDRQIGVINAAPFAQRLLTHTELPLWHPADNTTREYCRKAVLHCKSNRINPARLCVQFSTRHPDLSTCVIGTGNPDEVREWHEWLNQSYDEQRIREVQQILGPVMDRNSIYGRPENNDSVTGSTKFRPESTQNDDEPRPHRSSSIMPSRRH